MISFCHFFHLFSPFFPRQDKQTERQHVIFCGTIRERQEDRPMRRGARVWTLLPEPDPLGDPFFSHLFAIASCSSTPRPVARDSSFPATSITFVISVYVCYSTVTSGLSSPGNNLYQSNLSKERKIRQPKKNKPSVERWSNLIPRRICPNSPGGKHRMKVFSSDCTFDYSWDEVSTANWRKYCPWNDKSTHVTAVDTLSRTVEPSTGVVSTTQTALSFTTLL
jgi:hypothetical protein